MSTTVADVMTANPVMVQEDAPLNEAIRLMAEHRVSGLPVVDAEGQLVGVISESDLMWQETGVTPPAYIMLLDSVIYLENPKRYERELHKALGQSVKDVMTKEAVKAAVDLPLRKAAQLMHERHVRRLPVVNAEGEVVGILTQGDIVRYMATHDNSLGDD
jgi:CBS domain-containing protein